MTAGSAAAEGEEGLTVGEGGTLTEGRTGVHRPDVEVAGSQGPAGKPVFLPTRGHRRRKARKGSSLHAQDGFKCPTQR